MPPEQSHSRTTKFIKPETYHKQQLPTDFKAENTAKDTINTINMIYFDNTFQPYLTCEVTKCKG